VYGTAQHFAGIDVECSPLPHIPTKIVYAWTTAIWTSLTIVRLQLFFLHTT